MKIILILLVFSGKALAINLQTVHLNILLKDSKNIVLADVRSNTPISTIDGDKCFNEYQAKVIKVIKGDPTKFDQEIVFTRPYKKDMPGRKLLFLRDSQNVLSNKKLLETSYPYKNKKIKNICISKIPKFIGIYTLEVNHKDEVIIDRLKEPITTVYLENKIKEKCSKDSKNCTPIRQYIPLSTIILKAK